MSTDLMDTVQQTDTPKDFNQYSPIGQLFCTGLKSLSYTQPHTQALPIASFIRNLYSRASMKNNGLIILSGIELKMGCF